MVLFRFPITLLIFYYGIANLSSVFRDFFTVLQKTIGGHTKMTISERIFSLLEQQNKKQGDLAKQIGVRPATISDWKAKRTSPASDLLEAIAAFFGVSIDYLVTGREPQQPIVAQGIFGNENNHNTVTIGSAAARELSELETELLRICSELDIKRKTALLSYAYELEAQGK